MEAYEEDSDPGFQDSDRVATDKKLNSKKHNRSPKSVLRGMKHSIRRAFGKKTKKSNQNNKQQDHRVSETGVVKSESALNKESPETDVTENRPKAAQQSSPMSVGVAMASLPEDNSRMPKYAHISAGKYAAKSTTAISADSQSTTDSKHTPSEEFLQRVEAEAAQIQAGLNKQTPSQTDVKMKGMSMMPKPKQQQQQQQEAEHTMDGSDSYSKIDGRLDSPRTVAEDVSSATASGGNTQANVDRKLSESRQFLQRIEEEAAQIQAGLNQLAPRQRQTQLPSVVTEELRSTEATRLIGCVTDSAGHVKDRVIESARASVTETLVDAAGMLPTPLQQTVKQMTEPIEHAVEHVMGRITDTAIESVKEEIESPVAKLELSTRPARKAMELMYNLSFPIVTGVYVGLFAGITMIYATVALLVYLPLKIAAEIFVGFPLYVVDLVVTKRPHKGDS